MFNQVKMSAARQLASRTGSATERRNARRLVMLPLRKPRALLKPMKLNAASQHARGTGKNRNPSRSMVMVVIARVLVGSRRVVWIRRRSHLKINAVRRHANLSGTAIL